MARRMFLLACVGLSLALVTFAAVQAADPVTATVVSTAEGQLVVKDALGQEKTYAVPATATVQIDGQPAKLTDLQAGKTVEISMDDQGHVTAVVCNTKAPE